jgi:hypothetical protein
MGIQALLGLNQLPVPDLPPVQPQEMRDLNCLRHNKQSSSLFWG